MLWPLLHPALVFYCKKKGGSPPPRAVFSRSDSLLGASSRKHNKAEEQALHRPGAVSRGCWWLLGLALGAVVDGPKRWLTVVSMWQQEMVTLISPVQGTAVRKLWLLSPQ